MAVVVLTEVGIDVITIVPVKAVPVVTMINVDVDEILPHLLRFSKIIIVLQDHILLVVVLLFKVMMMHNSVDTNKIV